MHYVNGKTGASWQQQHVVGDSDIRATAQQESAGVGCNATCMRQHVNAMQAHIPRFGDSINYVR